MSDTRTEEQAFAEPGQPSSCGFEARCAAEIDQLRVHWLTTHQLLRQLGFGDAQSVVVDVDQIAGVGLQRVTRIQLCLLYTSDAADE